MTSAVVKLYIHPGHCPDIFVSFFFILCFGLSQVNSADDLTPICNQVNESMQAGDPNEVHRINQEIGQWFTDYLADSGYAVSKLLK